jgi:dethiobiotin synthetase
VTQRIVLLGTGTGVGKTYFGVRLAESLVLAGRSVLALKPIESGVPERPVGDSSESTAEPTDAERLARAATRAAGHCYSFAEPISPHLAARRAGASIELPHIVRWVRQHEEATLRDTTLHYTLIETAGGVLSPLGPSLTNFDLARSLEPATWVLVAPDSLGVLHDVRATLLAMRALGRRPDHVVLCGARPPDASTGTNRAELEALGVATISAELGRDAPPSAELCAFLTKT